MTKCTAAKSCTQQYANLKFRTANLPYPSRLWSHSTKLDNLKRPKAETPKGETSLYLKTTILDFRKKMKLLWAPKWWLRHLLVDRENIVLVQICTSGHRNSMNIWIIIHQNGYPSVNQLVIIWIIVDYWFGDPIIRITGWNIGIIGVQISDGLLAIIVASFIFGLFQINRFWLFGLFVLQWIIWIIQIIPDYSGLLF